VCGGNERFTGCGTACPLTCDNYDNPPKFCTLQCIIGCECQEGFVRNADGKCVLPRECPRCGLFDNRIIFSFTFISNEEESNCHDDPDGGIWYVK
ncbi:hypothetical protein CDAR_166731, partial [Caerostris darwini]